jgi:hypothetical protein
MHEINVNEGVESTVKHHSRSPGRKPGWANFAPRHLKYISDQPGHQRNLIANAIDASHESAWSSSPRPDGDAVEIEVADVGCGIDAAIRG